MPGEVGGAGESRESRGADRLDDWQRIEAEQADRAAEQRQQDAVRDPSPEFERSARDLGPDYGSERPRHRDISSEVAAAFGKTPEQVHALRDRMFDEMAARRERWAESEQPGVTSAENAPVGALASLTTQRGESSTMSLETRLGSGADAPTAREVLSRFAGPEGLTERQKRADEQYVAERGVERPWLRIAADQDPLVRHVYVERDRAGGHDPARHDGWRDAEAQEQRTAVATARTMEHPIVQEARFAEKPSRKVELPLEDVLGPDGYRFCKGYSLVTDGFDSPRQALRNRDRWVAEVREVGREQGTSREQAEEVVDQRAANSAIRWGKPESRPVDSFEGGTVQVNFKVRNGVVEGISTICYNPPTDETKRS